MKKNKNFDKNCVFKYNALPCIASVNIGQLFLIFLSFLESLKSTDPLKGVWQWVNISAFEFACKTFALYCRFAHKTSYGNNLRWEGKLYFNAFFFFFFFFSGKHTQKKKLCTNLKALIVFLPSHIFSISCINLTSICIKIRLIKICKLQSKIIYTI